ncbi:hypothetical protein HHI36_009456 [Cryptolaemus montrouzieri]|uniref:Bestrophin homolog n=1 Tax=Cryptolaemus montrouzieri TaxID=559131 RepID=A0ABD2MGA5_9CUCU
MERWWNQYTSLPFPDNLAILIGASIKGEDMRSRAVKRTMVRYVCVTFTITLTLISPKVKKRFPTLDHFIESGLLTKDEKRIMEELDEDLPNYHKYWLPLAWASKMVINAREEGLIRNDECIEKILDELNQFRNKCGGLLDYDWISVPLVYTQVVTIAVYSYFLISVVGNQHLNEGSDDVISARFPLIPVLEFFFYMGWLKVAETLINPFGDDDDDFEVMWMVDRHLQVGYLLVDQIPAKLPKLTKDMYWNNIAPVALPFTKASEGYMTEYPVTSTREISVSNIDQEIIMPQLSKVGRNSVGGTGKKFKLLKAAGFSLKNVTSGDKPDSDDIDEDFPRNDCPGVDESHPLCEAFEKLRKQRSEDQQKRLQRMLEHLKKKDEKKTE